MHLPSKYLSLLQVLVGNHEVAELCRGPDLVGQSLADRLMKLPVGFLAATVAVVHLEAPLFIIAHRCISFVNGTLQTCLHPVHLVVATLPHRGQAPLSSGNSSNPPIVGL